MPQPARLSLSHCMALRRWGGALVIKATSSSRRPLVCRSRRAAWRAIGKPMSSAATSAVEIARFSVRPLFFSKVRAWVGLGGSRGEIRFGSGDFLFDVGPQGRLVVLDGQEVVGSGFHHQDAGRLILSVQGV